MFSAGAFLAMCCFSLSFGFQFVAWFVRSADFQIGGWGMFSAGACLSHFLSFFQFPVCCIVCSVGGSSHGGNMFSTGAFLVHFASLFLFSVCCVVCSFGGF